jgi:hypothetical protein
MAKLTQLSDYIVNKQAQDIIDDLADGYLRLYSGTAPASADTPITSQTLLAEPRFASPSAPSPVAGLITFNPLTQATAAAQGNATFFRAVKSDGVTVVLQGTVGKGVNYNMNVNNTQVIAGAKVTVSGFTHQVEKTFSGV